MIKKIYTMILFIVSPFFLYKLYKRKKGVPSFGPRWKEHFGFTPKLASKEPPLWIHAVSVGESIAIIPLVKALKKRTPGQPILITTTSSTGAAQIKKLGQLVEHRFMPLDFSFAVKSFLVATTPKRLLIVETELWPNTLDTVKKFGIPISVINARLSEKSYHNYTRIQPLFNLMKDNIDQLLCQTIEDASRFNLLGIDESKISTTGSIKFDIQVPPNTKVKGQELRNKLGTKRKIWIAASTHKGEEDIVLLAHKRLMKSNPNALLIIVPRHPERFEEVNQLCNRHGFETVRRSSNKGVLSSTQVYLGDSMGEMLVFLSAADACFMGGSLAGSKVGGHNILEPAALGTPIVTGVSYYNFNEIVSNMLLSKGIIIVEDELSLSNTMSKLLNSWDTCTTMAKSASVIVKKNQGSIQKTIHNLDLKK
ncbi:lipid IV(A) 3-deoxy-D-manno-octulosonic acid transferase [Vibrio coralliirubri]|uniref:lipid IV(A) 3-deoxy-D-manno-octulosonic acid transferase n=1 Tax=Vibrio coralliirubri TaxID=1516159 RepID=UPI002FE1E234